MDNCSSPNKSPRGDSFSRVESDDSSSANAVDENENSDPQNILSPEFCDVAESVVKSTATMLPKLTRSRSAKLNSKSQQIR
jgi:hypothetical protein